MRQLMLLLAVGLCMGELPVLNKLLSGKVVPFQEDVHFHGVRVEVAGNVSHVQLPGEGLNVTRTRDGLGLLLQVNLEVYTKYHVKEGKYLGERGTANVTAELQYEATLDTTNRTDITYEHCKASLKLPHFKLTGVADLFRLEILEYAKTEVPHMLCKDTVVPFLLSKEVRALLAMFDHYAAMPLPNIEDENRQQEVAHGLQGLTGVAKYNESYLLQTVNEVLRKVFDAPVSGTGQTALGTVFDDSSIWEPYFPSQPAGFPSTVNVTLDTTLTTSGTTVHLLYAAIEGLDTINAVHVQPVTAYSLLAGVAFTDVNITLAVNVSVGTDHGVVLLNATGLTDFGLEASILAPIDSERAGSLTVGNMTSGNPACLLYPLLDFNITYLTVSMAGLQSVAEQGLLQGELQESINTALASALGALTPDLFAALPPVLQYEVLPAVNAKVATLLSPYLNATSNPCTARADLDLDEGYVALNTSKALHVLEWAVDSFIGTTDQVNINNITRALTGDGAVNLPYAVGGRVLEFSAQVSNISVSGLDTFTVMDLLHATSAYDMHNALKVGPRLRFVVSLAFTALEQQPFAADLLVDMHLPGFYFNVTTMTKVVKSLFTQVPAAKLLSPSCLLSTVAAEGLAVPHFNGSIDALLINITTLSQEGLPMLQQFEEDLQKPAAVAQMTHSVNVFLGQYMDVIMGRNATTQQLNNIANKSSCDPVPHTPAPTSTTDDALTQTDSYIIVFGSVVVVAATLLTIYFCKRNNDEEATKPLVGLNSDVSQGTPALFNHPAVPIYVRYGMPVLLACTICVFFAGNIGLGARVRATVKFAGSEVVLKDVFSYDLTSTISDMWNGNAYMLSVLIASFSGIWPYVKLLFLLFTWFSPSSVLATGTRGYILRVIDILGKWSLIDDFLMVFLMVAFRLHFMTPASWSFMPEGFVTVDLFVDPHFGMYAFLTAAISTLLLNHVQIAYHRSAVERDEGFDKSWFDVGAEDTTKRVLCLFTDDCTDSEGTKAKRASLSRQLVAWAVTLLLVLALALLVWGCTVDAFRFDFEGLAAYGLEIADPGTQTTQHSVFSLTHLMSQADGVGDTIGYGYLVSTFIVFSFFTPVLSMMLLLVLWTAPLKLQHQKYLFFINEMVAAWSAIEVLILALMAAVFELPQFAQFMIGNKCDVINEVTGVFAGPLNLDSSKCFDVGTTLLDGCWILFAAAVISNATFQITWYAAEHMIRKVEHHTGAGAGAQGEINDDAC